MDVGGILDLGARQWATGHAFISIGPCDTLATMSTVRVKICGITNLADATAAVDAGADYLGFIFWPRSKRAVSSSAAREIVQALRRRDDCPLLVGVFVDEPAEDVAAVLNSAGLDLAQLSGKEPPAFIGDPQSPLYGRSYKVLHPDSLAEAEADAEWYIPSESPPQHPSLLLDAYHPELPGGTGQRADWQIAAQLVKIVPRLMLAGGLNPQNVAEAVRRIHPFAVDVASGVEAEPGKKDHALVEAFISAAHNA